MSVQPTRDEEDTALAGEYVLGVLDAADRAAVERRIKSDPAFAARVTKWEYDLAGMNDDFAEAPAPNLLPAIEARLFGTPSVRPARGWFWRFLGGAAAAGALAVLVLATLPAPPPSGPVLTATLTAEGQPLVIAAVFDGNDLMLIRTAGEPAPPGEVHEAWLIIGDVAPVSLGLFDQPELRRPLDTLPEGAILAISLEPAGGSTTGAPTGPVLVTGVVAQGG
jgi:anti-sigma-K factor RskA